MTGSVRNCSPVWAGEPVRSVTAKIPIDLHETYVAACRELGQTKGAMARMLIQQFVEAWRREQQP